MNWASTAILGAATFGIVSILDSHLLSRRMPGLQSFLLPVALLYLIMSSLVLYLFPFPEGTETLPILIGIAGSMLRTAGMLITLYNLKREEVSRVIPVTFTYPVFVALIAIPLLGEKLSYLQWLAIIIVVAGAIIVSMERGSSGTTRWISRPFLLLFGASVLLALADTLTKYALAYISFWNMYVIAIYTMSAFCLIASARLSVFKQLRDMKRRNSTLALCVFNEMLALLAAMLQFWAMARGPVSLVSTISGTRPVFVVVYSLILGLFLPRFLIRPVSTSVIPLRLAAIIMIVGGVSIIYLT